MNSTPRIVIGLATRGDDLVPSLVEFIVRNTMVHGVRFIWRACNWSAPIAQEAVFQAAAELDPDYFLMLDSDVTPPIDALDKLLACEKDMVSAPIWHYNGGTGEIHLNIHKEFGKRIKNTNKIGIEKILTTSFGCLLLSRKTLKAFLDAKEEFVSWSPLIEANLKHSSSDVIMFRKAEKLGLELFCCWDVKGCEHYCRVHLSDRVLDQLRPKGRTLYEPIEVK